jgi:cephalosporin hydroxylase/glycosyltransferase involved in cell wall biosynthesis
VFPLWDIAIAPVLRAAGARRIVEIGALRGETTVRMLESLGSDAELHVVDPAPEFDPTEHERRFRGRYFFHRALSLQVLPELGAVDAALIDGDHNWYTVYHELKLLAEGARRDGKHLPVLVMHDVGWPYGRRDLYYAPEQIPAEYRQPHAHGGLLPGHKRLLPEGRGGLNPTMWNAEVEGGPRNGVMTALDDFVAEHDQPLRVVVVPIYFGLAVAAEQPLLDERPELAAAFDELERDMGGGRLLALSEDVRLRAMIFQHNVYFQRAERLERAIARHLETVKASLLHEHYLDDEARFAQLEDALRAGREPSPHGLRDPARHDQLPYRELVNQRTGPAGPDDDAATSFLAYAAMGRPQLDHLHRCLDAVLEDGVAGDLVECGVGRAGGAIFMRSHLQAHEIEDRSVWVLDPFRASPEPGRAPAMPERGIAGLQADLNLVRDGFARFGVLDDRVRFLQAPVADAAAAVDAEQIAVLRVGRSARDDVRAVLERLYDRVSDGGFVVCDLGSAGARAAVEAFRAERGIDATLESVDASAVAWRRAAAAERPGAGDAAATAAAGSAVQLAPSAPALPREAIELSVVVVVYNMRREAARTLRSLSRAYQQGIADLEYEVIVVENGSDPDQRLGEAFVASFGPEFRYVDLGDEARPSPVFALNRGIRLARGRTFALMIDGAHVLTPGVLRFARAGLSTYAPAIVATQQWYVGPGQQGDALDNGYDQDYEDRLFESIDWPHDGYRLFEIGQFVDERDWLDGVWESNCLFVERKLLEQVGCFDERFEVAGGGYANLDLYERLAAAPDVTVTTILGEGSFHQTHGGTTSNQPDAEERRARVFGYSQRYAELRGRPYHGPGKQLHYVGHFANEAARRTRPRRLTTEAFAEASATTGDGFPTKPIPVPDDLRASFTEAVWRSMPWERTTWFDRELQTAPTDLVAYQEILHRVRPDFVIETGTGNGARSLFLASICDLLSHGEVVSVDYPLAEDLPSHPRLHYVPGEPHRERAVERVRKLVGEGTRVVVILGGRRDRQRTFRQFEAYAPLVPVGSYLVFADTFVNGHPVWPAFGQGPFEAMKQVLGSHGEFVSDPTMEKWSLTCNPGGYLRRVR